MAFFFFAGHENEIETASILESPSYGEIPGKHRVVTTSTKQKVTGGGLGRNE